MKDYKLPSREECYELIEEFRVPVHIREHSEAVARLGVFLAERLNGAGWTVDTDLVDRACLLHDLFRVCEFPLEDFSWCAPPVTEADQATWRRLKAQYDGAGHEDAAAAFLSQAYPVLAETIRKHRYTAIVDEEDRPRTWEEKLVYYADKRVMHDTIVPLRTRLDEAHRRNAARRRAAGFDDADMVRIDAAVFALEAELFDTIGLEPDVVTSDFIEAYHR
jgi:hypothetical protein